jgi:hypothetical protein
MLKIYQDLEQGSAEWMECRRGIVTASEVKLLLTEKTMKTADNDKVRAHVWELLAQRISGFVEPSFIGDDMLRGKIDEIKARDRYSAEIAPVQEVGFITEDRWGFTIGYSPDGLVGDDGQVECKSRRQKFQVQVISEWAVPSEHIMQCQTGLLVTGRKWCDYVSYCGGLPMAVIRVYPDRTLHDAIIGAVAAFESRVTEYLAAYEARLVEKPTYPTEREVEQEIFV